MGWWADGTLLSTLAFNVANRSASWKIPARRGENQVVPGRSGSIPLSFGPTEDGAVSLDMWALGANLDGSMPVDKNFRGQALANLDRLTALFSRGGLIELVRAEDDSSYGRVNMIPNPALEANEDKVVVRENTIANPGGEYSSGLSTWRWNLLSNPNGNSARRATEYRRNYARNPRMVSEGVVQVVRRNLSVNPSFSVSTKTWTADPATTIARVKAKVSGWPIQQTEGWTLRTRTTASGTNFGAIGSPARVTAGTTYSFGVDYRNAAGSTKTISLIIQWRNKQGTLLSTSTASASAANGAIGRVTGSAAAPAGAWTATPRLRVVGLFASGETVYWDAVMIEAAATPGAYFDGSTPENDGLRYRWVDEKGLSVSEEYRVRPRGWTPGNTPISLTSAEAAAGLYSMKMTLNDTGSIGVMARQDWPDAARIGQNLQVSASIALRSRGDMQTSRSVSLLLECWDSDGTNLGACLVAVGGAAMTAVQYDTDPSGWSTATIDGVWTRPGTRRVTMTISRANAFAIGDAIYADQLLIEKGAAAGEWFDGAKASDDVFAYAWTGDRHWSDSTQSGQELHDWTALDGVQFQTLNGRYGPTALSVLPNLTIASTDRIGVQQIVSDQIRIDQKHCFSVYVNPNRTQNMKARIGVVSALTGVTTWTESSSTSCTAGSWTRLSVAATIPGETLMPLSEPVATVALQIRGDAAPSAGDQIDMDQFMFEPSEDARTWFSGDSGDGFEWLGVEERSVSVRKKDRADGWGPTGNAHATLERLTPGNSTTYCIRATGSETGLLGVTAGRDSVVPNTSYAFGADVQASFSVTATAAIVWRDQSGNVISSSTSTTALTANTWARMTVTATAPANAVTAAVTVTVPGAAPSATISVDNAVFGFGTTTTYADGNSGGGWEWVGVKDGSTSRNVSPAPNYWDSVGATFRRSNAWADNGTYSGLATVTATSGVLVRPTSVGKSELLQFKATKGTVYTGSARMKASASFRVTPVLVPLKWTGGAYVASGDPEITGTAVDFVSGDVKTVTVTGNVCPTSGAGTHFRLEFRLAGAGGGAAVPGATIALDKAILTTGSDATYFDGDSANARWTGDEDLSSSIVVAPARRCWMQVRNAIDMSSMAGGTRAEFTVEGIIPDGCWEDTLQKKPTYGMPRSGHVVSLVDFDGMTAMIEDAVFVLTGPFTDVKLTDMGTGAWVFLDQKVKNEKQVVIDSGTWSVRMVGGPSLIADVKHSGHPRLLPLSLEPGMTYPRVMVEASAIGDAATLQVKARRKFTIA